MTRTENGTEKDFQEWLEMESSRQKETRTKNDPEGDFKKMELTWGTAERETKDRTSWRKRNRCNILLLTLTDWGGASRPPL